MGASETWAHTPVMIVIVIAARRNIMIIHQFPNFGSHNCSQHFGCRPQEQLGVSKSLIVGGHRRASRVFVLRCSQPVASTTTTISMTTSITGNWCTGFCAHGVTFDGLEKFPPATKTLARAAMCNALSLPELWRSVCICIGAFPYMFQ